MRVLVDVGTLAEATSRAAVQGSFRFRFLAPIPVKDVRAALEPLGVLRLSVQDKTLHADIDTGAPETPVVTLDVIVRSDARGLERMLVSALPEVDRVVVGVDDRTTDDTFEIAKIFADDVYTFGCTDAKMTAEQWQANRIHFANVRNANRVRITTPWAFVLDSDEYLEAPFGLRAAVRAAPDDIVALGLHVAMPGFAAYDKHRVSRTSCRWVSETHNQLIYNDAGITLEQTLTTTGKIVHDTSLRAPAEDARRTKQRRNNVDTWVEGAIERGDMNAVFHGAKQFIGDNDIERGLQYTQAFRFGTLPRGSAAPERAYLAVAVAAYYYERTEDTQNAELWAVRAFLDGPCIEAACILGDLAEDRGDLTEALTWYTFACSIEDDRPIKWVDTVAKRFGRRAGLQHAVAAGLTNADKSVNEEPGVDQLSAKTSAP